MLGKSFYFLSLFDSRMRPKGSRDPLGSEVVWGYLGRKLVGNLTTVTSNLDNFFVALLSCEYAHYEERAKLSELQERFCRMEQALAYTRLKFRNRNKLQSILGVTKAKQRLSKDTILLGLSSPLLNNQLSMGLWGLYTPAMSRSGMIDIEDRSLQEKGVDSVKTIINKIANTWKQLCCICDQGELHPDKLDKLSEAVEAVFYDPVIRAQFVRTLIDLNMNCDAQSSLYKVAKQYLSSGQECETKVFVEHLTQTIDHPLLQSSAITIKQVEPLLVVNNCVFTWLQGQHDKSFKQAISEVEQCITESLFSEPELTSNVPHHEFILECVQLLNSKNTKKYLELLLEHHFNVMKKRNGAPWVEVRNGMIFVQVVSDVGKLPDRKDGFLSIKDKFENSYFLSSFLSIASEEIIKAETK